MDVNDKLTDLGLPCVSKSHLSSRVLSLGPSHPLLQSMRVILTELVPSLPGSKTTDLWDAACGQGLLAVCGEKPSPLQTINFLASELQTHRLQAFNAHSKPREKANPSPDAAFESKLAAKPTTSKVGAISTDTAAVTSAIDKLATAFDISEKDALAAKGTGGCVKQQPFTEFLRKVQVKAAKLSDSSPALLDAAALSTRRDKLDRINTALRQDYKLRRQMLLQRADITIQSFLWSDNVKESKLASVSLSALLHVT